MIEIPESATLARQGLALLAGKKVIQVVGPTHQHKFTWFAGDPNHYWKIMEGKEIESVEGYGSFVDFCLEDQTHLVVGDGTNIRYYSVKEQHPPKFQLMVIFDDYSCLVFTVAMYGGIFAFNGELDNPYYNGAKIKISPLDDNFDSEYFEGIIRNLSKDPSVKGLLATEQRIPGLGNGVLQDILFNAKINPKRKTSTLTDPEKEELFDSMKTTLTEMSSGGGRNTEKDMYGEWGRYRCILSKNTYTEPCPHCGSEIIKEAYMGGAVYYCPICQYIKKN